MIPIYKFISRMINSFINILFVVQIALMILVFLTATYWFLTLLDISAFSFVEPIANVVSDFVKIFYNQSVSVGGVFIDGSLLLFDIIAIVVVFALSKFKYYCHRAIDSLKIAIGGCEERREAKFNKELQKEVENNIKRCNDVAILVEFKAKNMMVDSCWGGESVEAIKEKEEEAFKTFFASIKNLTGCRFAKSGDKMLIMLNDFNSVDNVLNFIELAVNRIRVNMRKKKWLLISYISLDVYDNNTNFKRDVYPLLEKLVSLKIQNEPVCLGNFCMRYELHNEPMYKPFLRGSYNIIDQECEVWSLIKKN